MSMKVSLSKSPRIHAHIRNPQRTTSLCEDRNHLLVLISNMYRGVVVDAYIYHKYCKSSYLFVALILQSDVSMVELVTINKALPGDTPDYLGKFSFQ